MVWTLAYASRCACADRLVELSRRDSLTRGTNHVGRRHRPGDGRLAVGTRRLAAAPAEKEDYSPGDARLPDVDVREQRVSTFEAGILELVLELRTRVIQPRAELAAGLGRNRRRFLPSFEFGSEILATGLRSGIRSANGQRQDRDQAHRHPKSS